MADSESEDSENEGTMGNVNRLVMRPAGHSGKAKKGHLCFDASFETGNLGNVDLISHHEYDLFVRPDTCNPRLRLWFNFTVDNAKPDQRIIFNIVNFSKRRNCFRDGMTPIVRSTSRPNWQRMPRNSVFYHSSPVHNYNYVLSLAFNFDREEDVYHFAFSYPYSYTKCQAHLENLERRNLPYFKRELLCHSMQKRRLDLVTITHPKNMVQDGKVHVVVVMSRVHAGHSPSSYVCQGIIDFLISSHETAELLRENVMFKIMPMLNPDGVFLGNYRCAPTGADLNRCWGNISSWLHPNLYAASNYIKTLDQDKNIELDFVIDIYSHSNLRGVFVYGNTYNDVYRYERHIVFPKLLMQRVLGFESVHTHFNRDPNKANSSRRVLCDLLKDNVNCYSLIISFYGYYHIHRKTIQYYTEETYYRVGRNIVETFLDYYKATGVVTDKEAKVTKQKSARRRVVTARPRSKSAEKKPTVAEPTAADNTRVTVAHYDPRTLPPRPPPSLSIIDFNSMASRGLALALDRRP